MLASGGAVRAQINPTVPLSAARSAANQAQTSAPNAGQAQAQPKTRTQGQKAAPAQTPKQPGQKAQKPATPAPSKPATSNAKTKSDAKTESKVTKVSAPAPPATRRDPFSVLVGKQPGGTAGPSLRLPPGKAGLQIGTLILQGIVRAPNGMIAVVANPQKSVYFLHEGDDLFDGRVQKIELDGVTFHEIGKDAFGKPLERDVTKKLNPSSGEQP